MTGRVPTDEEWDEIMAGPLPADYLLVKVHPVTGAGLGDYIRELDGVLEVSDHSPDCQVRQP